MGKQPEKGQKKSKDAQTKAATQKKGGAKVLILLHLEMDQRKSQRKS